MKHPVAVLLYNIRSAHNVGSIFRTADAAGADSIVLAGYTPAPTDRFGRGRKDIAKVALGAESFLSYKQIAGSAVVRYIEQQRKEGWRVVAAEQSPHASTYREHTIEQPTLFIFGNETEGISEEILAASDMVIEIPMAGEKESLNVSVAVGVVLFGVQQ